MAHSKFMGILIVIVHTLFKVFLQKHSENGKFKVKTVFFISLFSFSHDLYTCTGKTIQFSQPAKQEHKRRKGRDSIQCVEQGCPIHPNWLDSSKVVTARLDSTRIVRCVVDSTNWKVDLQDTLKKSQKKANREGRKSGRIDSNRPLCSRFD